MDAGWFPDPTGRHAARYFDGRDWTDRAQGGDGQVIEDALERRSSGLAAPAPTPAPAPPPPAYGPPPGPAWGPPPTKPPVAKGTGVLGIAIAGFGWLLAAASLLALDWADGVTRGDISDALPDSLPDGVGFADSLWFYYVKGGGLALLVLVALGIGAAALGLIGRDPTVLRFLAGGLVLLTVVVHAVSIARGLRDQAELGAQLGTVAYLVVIAGLAIGSHTKAQPTA